MFGYATANGIPAVSTGARRSVLRACILMRTPTFLISRDDAEAVPSHTPYSRISGRLPFSSRGTFTSAFRRPPSLDARLLD
jgi:hypothetical protein